MPSFRTCLVSIVLCSACSSSGSSSGGNATAGNTDSGGQSSQAGSGASAAGNGGAAGGSNAGLGGAGGGVVGMGGGAGNSMAGQSGAAGDGLQTPIEWADAWVAGWYDGAASGQGVNRYDHVDKQGAPDGYFTQWIGDPGVTQFANVTDCSSFSDVLLTRSYGWVPPTAHVRPLAEDYYWAIRNGTHFSRVDAIADIAVGDTIALLYGTVDSGGDSGHVAWVDSVPETYEGDPEEPGLVQFAVTIVDSSHGFHYAPAADTAHQDTRSTGQMICTTDAECMASLGPSGVCDSWTLASKSVCAITGVGRGRLRLFADSAGKVAGYTWSTNSGSDFYPVVSPSPTQGATFAGRDVVVGRYAPLRRDPRKQPRTITHMRAQPEISREMSAPNAPCCYLS